MTKEKFQTCLSEMPVVAILRGITPGEVVSVCSTLHSCGIRLLEIPLNSPDAFESIAIAADYCRSNGMLAGAGTVLTQEDVRGVAASNGCFVISPNCNPAVIRETKACGMLSVPGFFTATEAFQAMEAGADYLKLFPAVLGPAYVKDLKAVVKAPIMAVGGVKAEDIPAFMKVCCGVGIGSAIYKAGKPLEQIRMDAAAIAKAAASRE